VCIAYEGDTWAAFQTIGALRRWFEKKFSFFSSVSTIKEKRGQNCAAKKAAA